MKKLKLNKKVVASLSKNDSVNVKGGYFGESIPYEDCQIPFDPDSVWCNHTVTCVRSKDICVHTDHTDCPSKHCTQGFSVCGGCEPTLPPLCP